MGALDHIDHVGSLVRPARVLLALDDLEDGRIDAAAFAGIADEAVRDAVRLQERVGLPYVTDGEFRRRSYNRGMVAAIEGMEQRPTPYMFRAHDGRAVPVNAGYASGRLKRKRPIVADDFRFLASVAHATPKVTLPSPSYFHFGLFSRCVDPTVYPDIDAFFVDLLDLYREEIAELASSGCRMLQLDDTALALLCDPQNQSVARAQGEDPDKLIDLYVSQMEAIGRACPNGMHLRVHLCRGNRVGMWAGSGGYGPIAERLFAARAIEGFLMEFDNDRSGGFEPLRDIRAGQRVFLGLISTKEATIESNDQLIRRVEEAARHTPIDRLGMSPQCGFGASALRKHASENPMTVEIETRKLERLAEAAGLIWNASGVMAAERGSREKAGK